jgi:hypothetical protein
MDVNQVPVRRKVAIFQHRTNGNVSRDKLKTQLNSWREAKIRPNGPKETEKWRCLMSYRFLGDLAYFLHFAFTMPLFLPELLGEMQLQGCVPRQGYTDLKTPNEILSCFQHKILMAHLIECMC